MMLSSHLSHNHLLSIFAIVVTAVQKDAAAANPVDQKNGLRRLTPSVNKETTYIVSFADKEIAPAKQCAALAKSTGGKIRHVFDHVLNGCSLTYPGVQAHVAVTALNDSPATNVVEINQQVFLAYQSEQENNIFESTSQMMQVNAAVEAAPSWGLDRINQCALPLDNVVTKQDASGVKVFVIDTGIYAQHEEFANGAIGPDDCHFSIFPGENALTDGHGHGTHVAGTTCGAQFGVSSNCQLCSVKVMNVNGGGTMSDIIAGINHVVAKCTGASGALCVANMSLVSMGYNEIFNMAVTNAVTKGVVMVVAAGNDNQDACSYSPASATSAITVGSTTIDDVRSSFSNWGSCIDIYAPGTDITSSWYTSPTAAATYSGTSMASPHVTGIAAAIRSANPSFNPAQVRDAIVNSAVVLPTSGINIATVDDISCTRPPTSAPTPCTNGMDIEIRVKTDYYPTETGWTLTNKCSGTVISSIPKYTNYVTMHSHTMLCQPAGEYVFTITDRQNDGICCRYGSGSYEVLVNGSIVRSGGTFRSLESTTFGICSAASVLITEPPTSYPTSVQPTNLPTSEQPTGFPTTTELPTSIPTTNSPTVQPTTELPTNLPTTKAPTGQPTTKAPTRSPSTRIPTRSPSTRYPTGSPTRIPSRNPTRAPTQKPTTRAPVKRAPTRKPIRR